MADKLRQTLYLNPPVYLKINQSFLLTHLYKKEINRTSSNAPSAKELYCNSRKLVATTLYSGAMRINIEMKLRIA